MPESLNTLPKEPPAAVIIIITAAELRDFPTHPPVDSISLLNLAGSVKDMNIPIRRAVTGCPMKPII